MLLALLLALCTGCASARPLSDALAQAPAAAQVRFLKESKGSNYLSTPVSGAALDALLNALRDCPEAKAPKDAFAPQLDSDEQIVLGDGGPQLYVCAGRNLVVWLETRTSKAGTLLQAHYYGESAQLSAQMTELRKSAALQQDETVQPFRSQEELKASIDTDDLAQDSNELDFDFYADALPDYKGTSCRAYDSASYAAVPADSALITAYGKSKTGDQVALPITGLEANPYYTKVLVSQPDDALDSVQPTDAPLSNAILVKRSALDMNKWIVFVDDSGNILDVIVPGDVLKAAPIVSASPSPSEEPPEGGDGSGDTVDGGGE